MTYRNKTKNVQKFCVFKCLNDKLNRHS